MSQTKRKEVCGPGEGLMLYSFQYGAIMCGLVISQVVGDCMVKLLFIIIYSQNKNLCFIYLLGTVTCGFVISQVSGYYVI